MNGLFIQSVIPGKAMHEYYMSINTIKTGVVEAIGRNSFVSSVKPVFCGLYHHSCHQ
jgi:hypothetical protein